MFSTLQSYKVICLRYFLVLVFIALLLERASLSNSFHFPHFYTFLLLVRFSGSPSLTSTPDLEVSPPGLSGTACFPLSHCYYSALFSVFLYSSSRAEFCFASLNPWCLVLCLVYSRCSINAFECMDKQITVIHLWKRLRA